MENPADAALRMKAIFNAIFLLSLSLLGFVAIGRLLGMLLAAPFLSVSLMDIQSLLTDLGSSKDGKMLIYFMQASATFGMFFLPYIFQRLKNRIYWSDYCQLPNNAILMLLGGLITLSFMGVNSIFIEWNSTLVFPEFMKDLESWARDMELRGQQMTEWMTSFKDLTTLFISLVIMAVLPAIAEEFVFRGVIQRQLSIGFNNIHLAIWVSAILFSGIHLQFFGFIPRMLLGALFGYLYFWSGNIWVPIFAHFVNNGFTLIMVYLNNIGIIDFSIQNSEAPSLASVLIFSIITFGLIYIFRNHYQKLTDG